METRPCKDCGTTVGLGWWYGRAGRPGAAKLRCHPCYLAYCRNRYAIQQARKGRTVEPLGPRSETTRSEPRWRPHSDPADFVRLCVVCGAQFVRAKNQTAAKVCSAECRKVTESAKNRRKALKRRGARIGQRYTLADVVARDGNRCHLCGKVVNLRLPGTDRRGPTVDHLLPIAAGGKDELANVRLAHRSCNCGRGVGGDVQLLLFG